jgi:hypothetical protein
LRPQLSERRTRIRIRASNLENGLQEALAEGLTQLGSRSPLEIENSSQPVSHRSEPKIGGFTVFGNRPFHRYIEIYHVQARKLKLISGAGNGSL